MNKPLVVGLILMLLLLVAFIVYNSIKYNNKWQVEYLNKVYPLANGKIGTFGPIYFDDLDFIYTVLLPDDVIKQYSKKSFKAAVPGPSCEELACQCDSDGMPTFKYDPDPIWEQKWPPCSMPAGLSGIVSQNGEQIVGPCCDSIENMKACMKYYKDNNLPSGWVNFDWWNGPSNAPLFHVPHEKQLWKSTLLVDYAAFVSRFPHDDWHGFYNLHGDPDNAWVEITHAYFLKEETGPIGTWFNRAKGSGMYLNLGKTFKARNKIHGLLQLAGLNFVTDLLPTMSFWLGNTSVINFEDFYKMVSWKIPGTRQQKLETMVDIIVNPRDYQDKYDWKFLYLIDRINNCGFTIDKPIVDHLLQLEMNTGVVYRTMQFTVQTNVYPGWITEIIYKGDQMGYAEADPRKIPKSHLRVFDPTSNYNTSVDCNFQFPFRQLYCDVLSDSILNPKIDAKTDPMQWETCSSYPSVTPTNTVSQSTLLRNIKL